ncbi:hypothetical protein OIU76_022787 [Salix suchowensis]|nr:hypothetical protein OIU76_022787 [Salix suchowensis]
MDDIQAAFKGGGNFLKPRPNRKTPLPYTSTFSVNRIDNLLSCNISMPDQAQGYHFEAKVSLRQTHLLGRPMLSGARRFCPVNYPMLPLPITYFSLQPYLAGILSSKVNLQSAIDIHEEVIDHGDTHIEGLKATSM